MKIYVVVFFTILCAITGTTVCLPIDIVFSNFVASSLNKLKDDVNVQVEFPDTLRLSPTSLLADIYGTLSEIKVIGLSNLEEVTSPNCQLSYGYCNVELVLKNFSLSGVYNLNGSVASAVELGSHGNWSIDWPASTKASFQGQFSTVDGIVTWDERFSGFRISGWYESSIKTTFAGLVNNGSLDKGLEYEILALLGNITRQGLTWPTDDLLTKAVVQFIQKDFNETSLLDILKENTPAVPSMRQIQTSRGSHTRKASMPNERFKAFAMKSLLELKEVVNSTLDIGSYRLNMDVHHAEFLTANGTLTDIKFVGLKEMFDLSVGEVTSFGDGRLAWRFHMKNTSISGKYSMMGKLAASEPLAAVGEFTITVGDASLKLDGLFKNENGYFKWDRGYYHGFEYTDDVRASFPEFIPTEDLGSLVKEAMLHILGDYIMRSMSYGILRDQLEATVIQHLEAAFGKIQLIDIVSDITGSH